MKGLICKYLNIDLNDFKEYYYDIITAPFHCSDKVLYGYNCWLAQALPQLNQNNKLVRYHIVNFLEKLSTLHIKI